jgi:hypothetical protein
MTLRDIQSGTVGVSYRASENARIELSLDAATASRPDSPKPLELLLDYRHSFGDRWRLNLYLLRGLSAANPDLGGGATLTYYVN